MTMLLQNSSIILYLFRNYLTKNDFKIEKALKFPHSAEWGVRFPRHVCYRKLFSPSTLSVSFVFNGTWRQTTHFT